MFSVRQNVFETNSSSTHSITICSKKQFEEWKAGLCRFDPYEEKFTPGVPTEKIEQLRKDAVEYYRATKEADDFCKKWDELSDEARDKYTNSYVQSQMQYINAEFGKTYSEYRYDYKDGCEYTEKYFKTEHGDEVVAFGKGGYDG